MTLDIFIIFIFCKYFEHIPSKSLPFQVLIFKNVVYILKNVVTLVFVCQASLFPIGKLPLYQSCAPSKMGIHSASPVAWLWSRSSNYLLIYSKISC